MNATYSIEDAFVAVALSGRFAMDDALRACRSALSDPRFEVGMPLLIDLREADDEVSAKELESSAAFIVANSDLIGGKHAIVVADAKRFDRAAAHTLRAIQFGAVSTKIFTSYEDAVSWLANH